MIKFISGLLVGLAVAVVGMLTIGPSFQGATYEGLPKQFGGGALIGKDNASFVTHLATGSCNASTSQLPLEATSTDDFTCTVSGVTAGDQVFVSIPSSGTLAGGFAVSYATASIDTITFGILNLTGAATSSFPNATTSVQYTVLRDASL